MPQGPDCAVVTHGPGGDTSVRDEWTGRAPAVAAGGEPSGRPRAARPCECGPLDRLLRPELAALGSIHRDADRAGAQVIDLIGNGCAVGEGPRSVVVAQRIEKVLLADLLEHRTILPRQVAERRMILADRIGRADPLVLVE